MNDVVYLIDRMILGSPKFADIRAQKVNYRIIEEIGRESRDAADYDVIKQEMVDNVTDKLIIKLHQIVPELVERKVLNLEKGNGDAMLAATAMSNDSELTLFPVKIILVTDDKRLASFCRDNSVDVLSPKDFFSQHKVNL